MAKHNHTPAHTMGHHGGMGGFAAQRGKGARRKKDDTRVRPIYFPNRYVTLNIASLLEPTRVVEFFIPLEMTKPELKRYLECFYQIQGIESVATSILPGLRKKDRKTGKWKKKDPDIKKARVTLAQKVHVEFTEDVRKEILRFKDRSLDKQIMTERRAKAMEEAQERMKQEEAKKLEASLREEIHEQQQQEHKKE